MKTKVLYPGTFDPVHYGHLDLMNRAALLFEELIIGVYDHNQPTKSLLFSVEERMSMIEEALASRKNITIACYSSLTVDFANKIGAQAILRGLRVFSDFEFEFRLALANKRLAPEIETISLMTQEEHTFLSSTTVREIASLGGDISSMVPAHVSRALKTQLAGGNGEEYNRPVPLRD